MAKYKDSLYPDKINDFIGNDGELSEEAKERVKEAGGLPDAGEASAGDVLQLDSNKKPVWLPPGGGTKLYLHTLIADLYSGNDIANPGTKYNCTLKVLFISTDPSPITASSAPNFYKSCVSAHSIIESSFGNYSNIVSETLLVPYYVTGAKIAVYPYVLIAISSGPLSISSGSHYASLDYTTDTVTEL